MSEHLELDVENVKCGGCASTIQEGLKPLDGIETVEVEIENGHVTISGGSLSETGIREKLAELGYPAK
ncbi:MAG TPA: heavy-metal-associated domain-containing protein [Gammaproteobacteria bacterium]|nr:heavy-metal-associated domain-containing protein [Gammaproteobacteria bacterium]